MNNESALLKKFLLEYSRIGSRLFRFQSGLFWAGKSKRFNQTETITAYPGDVLIRKARRVRSGQKGMSDLIGFTKINITQDMVGREVAVFTAVEAKTENVRATKEQLNFIRTVNDNGGIALIARKLEDIFQTTSSYLKGNQNEARH